MKLDDRLRMFAGLMLSATDLNIWSFDLTKKLLFSTSNHKEEFSSFLLLSGCLDYMIKKGKTKVPILLSDKLELLWVAEFVGGNNEDPTLIIVAGPFFSSEATLSGIENSLNKFVMSTKYKKEMLNILSSVPMIKIENAHQYAVMLHYTITNEVIKPKDILYQKKLMGLNEIVKDNQINEEEYLEEQMLMQSIREGNFVFKKLIDKDAYIQNIEQDNKSLLREIKNNAILKIGIGRNASIDGGVSFKIAKEIEKITLKKIEECDTVGKLYYVFLEGIENFVLEVKKINSNPNLSKGIQECCLYIKNNILEPLTLEEIADVTGYSEYYLTKKFQKEMGIKLNDYIKQNRIEIAKFYLIGTNKSVQEISDLLHFNTRNYFNRIFRELVGVSPNSYRKKEIEIGSEVKNETD